MAYKPKFFRGWTTVKFPTTSQGYDPNLAWWLAQCSQLTYENKITVATELKQANFNQVVFFDANGTQAFLAKHPGVEGGDKFAVLAFRGTEEDSIDILTDINFVKRLFPSENLLEEPTKEVKDSQKKPINEEKLYAHGGFLQGVHNIWGAALHKEIESIYPQVSWQGAPGISEAICELGKLEPGTPLYFTGHSLGGALATLAAYKAMVYKSNVEVTALYTFGSPKTAQRPLAELINTTFSGKLYRVVNYIDVVPRLPPRIPRLLDFRHTEEKLIYFTKRRKQMSLSASNIFWGDIGVLALAFLEIGFCILLFKKYYTPQTIKSHMICEYIKDIEKEIV